MARIGAAYLTPAARTRIAQILEVPDTTESVADALAAASTWPDEIKKDRPQTAAWHYIDLTLQDRKSDISERCIDNNCVTARIRLFAAQLSAKTTNSSTSDLDALRFLVHFVGDVHQPLHAVSDADQGGNCEPLDPPVEQAKNVHALWDGPLVTLLSSDAKALADELSREIGAWGPGRQQQIAAGNQNDWAWESHELAERDVYRRLKIPTEPVFFPTACSDAPEAIRHDRIEIPSGYVNAMKPVVRLQLERAGIRLARLLNEAL